MMLPPVELQKQLREVNSFTKSSLNRPRMADLNTENEVRSYYAIQNNDVSVLKSLMQEGMDPNYVFEGSDPLGRAVHWPMIHFCAEKGRYDCAKILLEAGADPNSYDRWGESPMMYAIQCGRYKIIDLLIKFECDVDACDNKGWVSLHYASEHDDPGPTRKLLTAGADPNRYDKFGRSPLWHACRQDGRAEHVRLYVEHNADPDELDGRDRRTPLQEAICHAKIDRVQYVHLLVAGGADVNIRDRGAHNSLLNLIHRDRTKSTELDDEEMEIAEVLVGAGYKLNAAIEKRTDYEYTGTPLKMAAERGASKLVMLLAQNGCDPDLLDDWKTGALHMAVLHGHYNVVRYLCQINCILDKVGMVKMNRDVVDASPLRVAILKRHWEIAQLLVDCGHSLETESYILTNVGVPEDLILYGCDFWNMLVRLAANPLDLLTLTQRKIRKILGLGIAEKLEKVPLPKQMKDYVLMKYLFGDDL